MLCVLFLAVRKALGRRLDKQTVVGTNGNCTPHELFFLKKERGREDRRGCLYSWQQPRSVLALQRRVTIQRET